MTTITATCPVCGGGTEAPFVSIPAQPVHCNVLWDSHDGAVSAVRGDMDLVFCPTCGHVHNASFDPELTTYGGTYENSLHHSAVFQEYAEDLIDSLVERHDLRDSDVVEVGAGQGDFLEMLCAAGDNRGTGFDPSHIGDEQVSDRVRVVTAFYGERFADHPADLIACRHVLEHIDDSGEFVQMIRRVIGERDTLAFFEVPNAMWTLVDGGIWDLIYEHCGYFTPTSLHEVFRRADFDAADPRPVFGNQFLTIEATPRTDVAAPPDRLDDDVSDISDAVTRFAADYRREVDGWNDRFASMVADGRRGVIWGAGSKGVSFLNTIETAGVVDRAVDINPRKHGMFVAGAGQEIVGPDALTEDPPDTVLVMNPNYRDEIAATLASLDLDAELVTV